MTDSTPQSWVPDNEALMRCCPDAVVVTCPKGLVLDLNLAAEKQFGISKPAALGRELGTLVVLPSTAVGASAMMQLLQIHDLYAKTRSSRLQLSATRLDGQTFPVELSISPVRSPEGLKGYILYLRDNSKAKRAEETYQRLVDVINATPDFVALWDDVGNMIYHNPAATKYIGTKVAKPSFQEMFHYRPQWAIDKILNEAIPTVKSEGIWRGETALLRDGVEVPVSQVLVSHKNVEGTITHYSSIMRDISDLKVAQHSLVDATRAAREASEAKSRFVASMSHEIRTPMTAIVGYADLLVRPNITVEDRELWGRGIRQNSEYLLSLVNDILDISKIEAGQVVMHPSQTDSVGLLADVETLLRPIAVEKMLDFQVIYEGQIPRRIITDPTRLKQILVNLVANAIKFTEQGGVSIRVSTFSTPGNSGTPGSSATPGIPENQGVSATGAAGRCLLRFSVKDTGIGISSENIGLLFKAFGQVHGENQGRFGGTGLGLVISRQLALLLGGDVTVESQPGVGSTFTLSLDVGPLEALELVTPVKPRRTAPTVEEGNRPTAKLDGVEVLVVDDNPDNQRIIRFLLEDSRAIVTTADNGQIGVDTYMAALAAGRPYEMIFMDMQMPVMDGYDATRTLRSMGVTTPIVALTAFTMMDDKGKCLAAGCNAYVTKPIVPAELFKTVTRIRDKTLDRESDAGTSGVEPGVKMPSPSRTPPESIHLIDGTSKSEAKPEAKPEAKLEAKPVAPIPEPVVASVRPVSRLISTMANNVRFAPLLKEYIAGMPDTIKVIEADRADWNINSLKVRAHRIKGTAASYGYPTIGEVSGHCEAAILDGQPREVVEPLVEQLIGLLRAASN